MLSPLELLDHFRGEGAYGLVCLALIERLVPIIPSHALLVLIGLTLVGSDMNLPHAISSYTLGSMAGAVVWYSLGRWLGSARVDTFITRYGRYAFIRPETYRHLAAAYSRRRFLATFIGQLLPGIRLYLPIPAGVFLHPLRSFLLAAGAGIVVWNSVFLSLGAFLKDSGYPASEIALWAMVFLVIAETVLGGAVWVWRRRST